MPTYPSRFDLILEDEYGDEFEVEVTYLVADESSIIELTVTRDGASWKGSPAQETAIVDAAWDRAKAAHAEAYAAYMAAIDMSYAAYTACFDVGIDYTTDATYVAAEEAAYTAYVAAREVGCAV